MLPGHTERHPVRLWNIWVRCFNGLAMARRGDFEAGTCALREGLGQAGDETEALLQLSLDLARAQGALAWELRTATSLAHLRIAQRREAEAATLLRSVQDRFTQGVVRFCKARLIRKERRTGFRLEWCAGPTAAPG